MRGKYSTKAHSESRLVTIATRATANERNKMDAICARNKISRSTAIRRLLLGIDDETFRKIVMA